MNLLETFQVATIVEKLSPAWRDFKNYLKHKRKELKLERSHCEVSNQGGQPKVRKKE